MEWRRDWDLVVSVLVIAILIGLQLVCWLYPYAGSQ